MKIALVGATGMVGQVMLKVLEEKTFPFDELLLVASKKSLGKKIFFSNKEYTVISINEALERQPNLAFFSAGSAISLEWAPKFSRTGCKVIDNSSAFRMNNKNKLIIPEINADILTINDRIIANPNCSTIQLIMALYPLDNIFKIRRVVVSTYQSVTGTGASALQQLEDEEKNKKREMIYPYQIYRNCIPHCDNFQDNGYTTEELKLENETKKILRKESLNLTATAVRIPVTGGHSESVNIEFEKDFTLKEVYKRLKNMEGVILLDNLKETIYPMPLYAKGKDDVFVGRLRRDFSQPNSLNMWIVTDNLRKGAATNAIQIGEYLLNKDWL